MTYLFILEREPSTWMVTVRGIIESLRMRRSLVKLLVLMKAVTKMVSKNDESCQICNLWLKSCFDDLWKNGNCLLYLQNIARNIEQECGSLQLDVVDYFTEIGLLFKMSFWQHSSNFSLSKQFFWSNKNVWIKTVKTSNKN